MVKRTCDRCGQPILEGELRYLAKIQVSAAYDPLQISFEDLLKDHRHDMERLLKVCEGMTEKELMQDVYVDFQFDLCRPCQKAFISNPLPKSSPPQNSGTAAGVV